MSCGILIGSDKHQQSLLPFFWLNYRLHNSLPVTFINFGMDKEYIEWCNDRGKVIHLINDEMPNDEEENEGPSYKNPRKSWFLKPLALLQTPYEKSIWLDIDCFIRGNISSLLELCENDVGLAMVQEPDFIIKGWQENGFIPKEALMFNSGVISFKKQCPILPLWLCECKKENNFRGDQEALASILFKLNIKPALIPETFNWLIMGQRSLNKNSSVLHMTGPLLKKVLKLTNNAFVTIAKQSFKI